MGGEELRACAYFAVDAARAVAILTLALAQSRLELIVLKVAPRVPLIRANLA